MRIDFRSVWTAFVDGEFVIVVDVVDVVDVVGVAGTDVIVFVDVAGGDSSGSVFLMVVVLVITSSAGIILIVLAALALLLIGVGVDGCEGVISVADVGFSRASGGG